LFGLPAGNPISFWNVVLHERLRLAVDEDHRPVQRLSPQLPAVILGGDARVVEDALRGRNGQSGSEKVTAIISGEASCRFELRTELEFAVDSASSSFGS